MGENERYLYINTCNVCTKNTNHCNTSQFRFVFWLWLYRIPFMVSCIIYSLYIIGMYIILHNITTISTRNIL